MDLSETIVAAMIGAIATISTALFQLFSAFKSSDKADPKIQRRSKWRSLLSIAALMVVSAVGGFLYSEFREQAGAADVRALRDELREVHELAVKAAGRQPAAVAAAVQSVVLPMTAPQGSAEALIYVPACRPLMASEGTRECGEADAQRVALCGTIPAQARIEALELYAQADGLQGRWADHVVLLEQDLGGARFSGKSFAYAQDQQRAVCVSFLQWSSAHPYLARLVVRYGAELVGPVLNTIEGPPPELSKPIVPVIAVDSTVLAPHAASLRAPGATSTSP